MIPIHIYLLLPVGLMVSVNMDGHVPERGIWVRFPDR